MLIWQLIHALQVLYQECLYDTLLQTIGRRLWFLTHGTCVRNLWIFSLLFASSLDNKQKFHVGEMESCVCFFFNPNSAAPPPFLNPEKEIAGSASSLY